MRGWLRNKFRYSQNREALNVGGHGEGLWERKAVDTITGAQGSYGRVEKRTALRLEEISLKRQTERGKLVFSADGASLIDLGDEVACLAFHSKNQRIGPGVWAAITRATEEVVRNWRGLVIGNEEPDFCVGGNLMLLLMEAENGEWEEIDLLLRECQQSIKALKMMPRPVVAAPHRKALGVGAEICLSADQIILTEVTHFGIVEAGIGLIPAGGGCLAAATIAEEYARGVKFTEYDDRDRVGEAGFTDYDGKRVHGVPFIDIMPPLANLFESIALASVSVNDYYAERLGYWWTRDPIVVREETRITEAKRAVLELDRLGYEVSVADRQVIVGGREGAAQLKLAVSDMRRSGRISQHDAYIASKLAEVMSGGQVPGGMVVPEQYLLDLEREAFLSLCGHPLTQARMKHMLATGRRLHN